MRFKEQYIALRSLLPIKLTKPSSTFPHWVVHLYILKSSISFKKRVNDVKRVTTEAVSYGFKSLTFPLNFIDFSRIASTHVSLSYRIHDSVHYATALCPFTK